MLPVRFFHPRTLQVVRLLADGRLAGFTERFSCGLAAGVTGIDASEFERAYASAHYNRDRPNQVLDNQTPAEEVLN